MFNAVSDDVSPPDEDSLLMLYTKPIIRKRCEIQHSLSPMVKRNKRKGMSVCLEARFREKLLLRDVGIG